MNQKKVLLPIQIMRFKEHQSLSMIQQEIQEIVADGFVGKERFLIF